MSLAITSISMSGININPYYKLCKCILEIHMTDRAAYSFINGWLAGLLHARQHQLNDCTECVEIQHRTATGLPKGKRSSVHSTTGQSGKRGPLLFLSTKSHGEQQKWTTYHEFLHGLLRHKKIRITIGKILG